MKALWFIFAFLQETYVAYPGTCKTRLSCPCHVLEDDMSCMMHHFSTHPPPPFWGKVAMNKMIIFNTNGHVLTLYHTISTSNDPVKEFFRKHCGKMLVTSIFSLSNTVFYPFKNKLAYPGTCKTRLSCPCHVLEDDMSCMMHHFSTPPPPILGKSSNEQNDYFQYKWACFNPLPHNLDF